jgi:cytochrome c oxidase cbb3-type subunit 2
MPGYPWLKDNKVDGELIAKKMRALRILNTPYTDEDIANAADSVKGKTEMDALIAYLQVLGTHVSTRR